jgi:hypothetical protein
LSDACSEIQSEATYLNLNLMGRWNKLLKLRGGLFKSWSGDICHKDIGTFLGEEDTCFEADTTM